jgi:hypothetical protein
MLVTGVHVCLHSNGDQAIKVMNVHMNKDSKQPGEDLFTDGNEILGKRNIRLCGKDFLRIDLSLDPVHQVRDILNRWQGCRLLELVTICPQVLVPFLGRRGKKEEIGYILGNILGAKMHASR